MKGVSPFLATVLLIAFTIAVGAIVSLFITNMVRTQSEEASTTGGGVAECAGSYINVINVTTGTIIVENPNRNLIYTVSVYDSLGNINGTNYTTDSGVKKSILPGTIQVLTAANVPNETATAITITGFCENSEKTTNNSITGICQKGWECWES